MRSLALALLLVLLSPAHATVADGVGKWNAGDYEAAVAAWSGPAARGDPDALFNMGQAYHLGRGVARDDDVAIDYYRRAANRGHVAATTNLGITLFQTGRKTEALNLLRRAAGDGDLRASYVLGMATFGGEGAPRNRALGYAYVLRARDGGLAIAAGQAERMAARMTAAERADGIATAQALAGGQPVADVDAPPAGGSATVTAAAGWKVQLGAYRTEGAARTAWATLVSQSASQLRGLAPIYASGGRLVRLQVGPYAGKAEADGLCASLAADGRPCFVTR